MSSSCNQCGRRCRDVPELWRQTLDTTVVAGQSVKPALDKDETEFGVLILPVLLQMFADRDCLLDEEIQIFWKFSCLALCFQYAEDFLPCDSLHLRNSETVSQSHPNLGWCQSFLGQLANMITRLLPSSSTMTVESSCKGLPKKKYPFLSHTCDP